MYYLLIIFVLLFGVPVHADTCYAPAQPICTLYSGGDAEIAECREKNANYAKLVDTYNSCIVQNQTDVIDSKKTIECQADLDAHGGGGTSVSSKDAQSCVVTCDADHYRTISKTCLPREVSVVPEPTVEATTTAVQDVPAPMVPVPVVVPVKTVVPKIKPIAIVPATTTIATSTPVEEVIDVPVPPIPVEIPKPNLWHRILNFFGRIF